MGGRLREVRLYYRDAIIFEKLRFRNVLYSRENEKPAFSNPSGLTGLKSVFENLRFRDGLVWTLSLTVELKLRISNSSGVVSERCLWL